eukprot:391275-Pleurochrysis_carterae.AAC.2
MKPPASGATTGLVIPRYHATESRNASGDSLHSAERQGETHCELKESTDIQASLLQSCCNCLLTIGRVAAPYPT